MPARHPYRRRSPATTIGAAITVAGAHAGLWFAAPWLAITLTLLEAALTTVVVLTALYANTTISDRAFRMLPWTTPPSPQQHLAPQRTHRP
ncbi:hypothetical protein ACFYYL_43735 [Actinomadura geliboluensis]|uniref:hypothetical protein n=1 Tax=Actinomadura geliboluensis TaxID=882440 RepID=UPI0036916D52